MTRLRPAEIVKFMGSPEESLSGFDLKVEDYEFLTGRTCKGIRVNGFSLRDFPVLVISDRDHNKWLEAFRNDERNKQDTLVEKIADEEGVETEEELALFKETLLGKKPGEDEGDDEIPF